jgi:hypothetical protein
MRTEKIGRYTVELFDSISELSIKRFHKFNKYMLIDSGVGSDLEDIDHHIMKIDKYIRDGDKKNAIIQLQNMRQSLYMITQEVNIKHLSFGVLVNKINGKTVFDLSDENIKKIQDKFMNTRISVINRILETVKKKLDEELNLYFPNKFDDISVKEYYEKLKARTLLTLNSIIEGTDNKKLIEDIDNFLLSLAKPKIFSGTDNAEIQFDKQFEDMCLLLTRELSLNIDELTVLQFYNSFEYLKKLKKIKNG